MIKRKLNEKYITKNNLPKKTRNWLEMLRPFTSVHRSKEFKFAPDRSVLLIIDMQKYFLDPKSPAYLPAAPAIVQNIRKILYEFRIRNLPVIFTYYAQLRDEDLGIMARWWKNVLYDDDPLADIDIRLTPLKKEHVIRKSKYCAFLGTNLNTILKQLDVKQVLITGVMTHLCCESTARAAFMRDYEVYFCVDGTATQFEDFHIGTLKALTDGFAMMVTIKGVLDCLKQIK